MEYSILPKDPAKKGSLGDSTLYHLSLDRAFSIVCPHKEEKDYFLSELSRPLTCPDTILERQEILKDFMEHPSLFSDLTNLYSRFHELLISNKEAGKGYLHIQVNRTQSLDSVKNQLQTYALYCKRALLFVQALGQLLFDTPICSRGLIALREGFLQISRAPDFQTMISYCTKFENFTTSGALDFRISLGEDGYIAGVEWIEHEHIRITDPDLKIKRGFLFQRKQLEVYPCARLYPQNLDFYEKMMLHALAPLSVFFRSITDTLSRRFDSVYRELIFYSVALKYTELLQKKNLKTIFPKICAQRETEFRALSDLYLAVSTDSVTPNDAKIAANGTIVFGENGSGKTVFLRSFATAQILTQAGLPIPAEYGTVKPYSKIVTQFSSSEKEPIPGSGIGRFETEVKELSEMIDTLHPGTLIFLNETFQSTSYEEGAEGLYHILRYLSDKGVFWVLVSHLHGLLPKFKENGVELLCTKENYQVCPIHTKNHSL